MRNLWFILLILISLSNRADSTKELDHFYSNLTMIGGDLSEVTISYQQPDVQDIALLARLIYCESGYEPMLGKLAVGQVVLNRMKMFNQTMSQVVYAKGQFDGVRTKYFYRQPNEESWLVARKLLYGTRIFPEDVVYFANIAASTDRGWLRKIRNHRYIAIANHTFYTYDRNDFTSPKDKESLGKID